MSNKEYTKKLEQVIKNMLQPLKDVPFSLAIEAISNCKVISFDKNKNEDLKLLKKLEEVAQESARKINKEGIKRKRANEVGNDAEDFVIYQANIAGIKAERPENRAGKKQVMGYPDILLIDKKERAIYLEIKTYNQENIESTQKTFYFSPSENFKVKYNGLHIALSFEIHISGNKGEFNVYKCRGWKILDLSKLMVDVKHEFNANNKQLYHEDLIISGGEIN